MRTTVDLDDDTTKAVDALRRSRGIGLSEAVNELIRQGLIPRPATKTFRQRTSKVGLRIDVSNVAEALEVLEGTEAR
jgi:hypothetical protein